MHATISYTPATQFHTNVRCERAGHGTNTWSIWETVTTGSGFTPIPLSSGQAYDVRLISVDTVNTRESSPSSLITISFADATAAMTPPILPPLDPPSGIGVAYSA